MCLKCETGNKKLDKSPAMECILKEDQKQDNFLEELNQEICSSEGNFEVELMNFNLLDSEKTAPLSTTSRRYFVSAEFANLRNGPSTGASIVGRVNQGQIIETAFDPTLDRSPTQWNSNWGWIRLAGSNNWIAGWSGTGFSNSGGGHLMPVHTGVFVGHVTLPQVNFRTGPGTEFPTSQIRNLMSLPQGTRINARYFVARNSHPWSFTIPRLDLTQIWIGFTSIVTPAGESISGVGWVRADLIVGVPNNLVAVSEPLMGSVTSTNPVVIVMSPFANMRTHPGTHTGRFGEYQQGQILHIEHAQHNITEDRTWLRTRNPSWVASENTVPIEVVHDRVFRVNVPSANVRNAPDVSGTTIVGTIPANSRLRVTHRRRVSGGMDWFRYNQVIGGLGITGWIADINGFIEGEVGSPGVPMPANHNFPNGWIDSRNVSMRNPDYREGHTSGPQRPFYLTRELNEINQIVIHHTASPTTLQRVDIETGWRGLGWWNGGYHEIIHANGSVDLCYEPNVVTNGAYGQNRFSYHIALVGNFSPSVGTPPGVQMETLIHRIRQIQSRFNITPIRVVGHNERTATYCPGIEMSLVRNRLGVPLPRPPHSGENLNFISDFLRELPRNVMNILGLGEPLGAINFLPNMINIRQKKRFFVPPMFEGMLTFQEVFDTSHIQGFNIKDGKIEPFSFDEVEWNLINLLIPDLTVNLLRGRLGEFVQNGSAVLTIEPGSDGGLPWLTLKIAAEVKLPSGNKFKYVVKFQLRPLFSNIGDGGDWDLNPGFEPLPIPIGLRVRDVEREAMRDSRSILDGYRDEGLITAFQWFMIIVAIGVVIAKFPLAVAAGILFLIAVDDLESEINRIFRNNGIDSEIRLSPEN